MDRWTIIRVQARRIYPGCINSRHPNKVAWCEHHRFRSFDANSWTGCDANRVILTKLCRLGPKRPHARSYSGLFLDKMPLPSQTSNTSSFSKPLKFGRSKVGTIPAQVLPRERRLHSWMSGQRNGIHLRSRNEVIYRFRRHGLALGFKGFRPDSTHGW